MAGGPMGGGGSGTPPAQGGGGTRPVGTQIPPPVVDPDSWKPVGFSFISDEAVTADGDHYCMTYDPTQPSDPNPFPSSKEEIEQNLKGNRLRGHFVDRCPTENVVATCDHRRSRQVMTWYYKGKTPGDLHFTQKAFCASPMFRGAWTWVVQPDPVAKPTSTGPVAFACDNHQVTFQCQTFRPDMDPKKLQEQKAGCPILQGKVVDHCPVEGLAGRCEDPATGVATYYYMAVAAELAWPACDKHGGKWSAP